MPPMRPGSAAETTDVHARVRQLEQENARLLEEQQTRQQETKALASIGRTRAAARSR